MLQFIFDGGFLMYPIALLSIFGFAVIIDRFLAFRVAGKIDNEKLITDVIAQLNDGNIEGAMDLCIEVGGPVGAILLHGIQKFNKLRKTDRSINEVADVVKVSMEEYAPQVVGSLDKYLGALPIVASLSPLLGMTGTVTGMITSFDEMAKSTTLEATAVSGGISEALITTAAGLLVAMPAVIAYNIFSRKVDANVQYMDTACNALVDYISFDYKG